MFGSLAIIWPWKNPITSKTMLNRHGEEMIIGYERYLPNILELESITALFCLALGVFCIWLVEKLAIDKK